MPHLSFSGVFLSLWSDCFCNWLHLTRPFPISPTRIFHPRVPDEIKSPIEINFSLSIVAFLTCWYLWLVFGAKYRDWMWRLQGYSHPEVSKGAQREKTSTSLVALWCGEAYEAEVSQLHSGLVDIYWGLQWHHVLKGMINLSRTFSALYTAPSSILHCFPFTSVARNTITIFMTALILISFNSFCDKDQRFWQTNLDGFRREFIVIASGLFSYGKSIYDRKEWAVTLISSWALDREFLLGLY